MSVSDRWISSDTSDESDQQIARGKLATAGREEGRGEEREVNNQGEVAATEERTHPRSQRQRFAATGRRGGGGGRGGSESRYGG